jgi:hypothetical protein
MDLGQGSHTTQNQLLSRYHTRHLHEGSSSRSSSSARTPVTLQRSITKAELEVTHLQVAVYQEQVSIERAERARETERGARARDTEIRERERERERERWYDIGRVCNSVHTHTHHPPTRYLIYLEQVCAMQHYIHPHTHTHAHTHTRTHTHAHTHRTGLLCLFSGFSMRVVSRECMRGVMNENQNELNKIVSRECMRGVMNQARRTFFRSVRVWLLLIP